MKPQEKVVSAQDVQNCLYYLHAANEAEDRLRISEDFQSNDIPEEDDSNGAEGEAVHRDPFGTSLSLPHPPPLPDRRRDPPPSAKHRFWPPYGPTKSAQIARKAVGSNGRPAPKGTEIAPTLPPRKVLGPRPLHDRLHSVDSAALESVPQRQNVDLRTWSEQPPLPPRPLTTPYGRKLHDLERTYSVNCAPWVGAHSSTHKTSSHDSRPTIGEDTNDSAIFHEDEQALSDNSLTLIRRYDGIQSNVGKIVTTTMAPEAFSAKSRNQVLLEILSPGYMVFARGNRSNQWTPDSGSDKEELDRNGNADILTFKSHLCMPSTSKRPQQTDRSESSRSSFIFQELRNSADLRGHSEQRSGDVDPAAFNDTIANERNPTEISFQSPWNGICDFTTGIAGRSLKCRHRYRSGTFNPVRPVSELRFNLPSSKTFGSPAPKSPTPGTPRELKRSSFFSNHRRHSSIPSQDFYAENGLGPKAEPDGRLDLSLGQEHAGGGFGGKQAKLGKLIVENEGLQMLDLVVAANMAMWWLVYDRLT